MLTLSRKEDQAIVITIGDKQLYMLVSEVGRGKVKIAFDGSEEFQIWREEIHNRKVVENMTRSHEYALQK